MLTICVSVTIMMFDNFSDSSPTPIIECYSPVWFITSRLPVFFLHGQSLSVFNERRCSQVSNLSISINCVAQVPKPTYVISYCLVKPCVFRLIENKGLSSLSRHIVHYVLYKSIRKSLHFHTLSIRSVTTTFEGRNPEGLCHLSHGIVLHEDRGRSGKAPEARGRCIWCWNFIIIFIE